MILVFDVNGTLLDTRALAPDMRRIFGTRYTVREWFGDVIVHAMATTAVGQYREFGDIALAVLEMAAVARGVRLGRGDAERIRRGMRELPPFAEVREALERLRQGGFGLAALSNSAPGALKQQLRNAGLTPFFQQVLSVGAVKKFKPAVEVYDAAARALDAKPGDLLMVAAHSWDLMGAARAGWRTAFLARPGQGVLPGFRPDYEAGDLSDLAGQLLGDKGRRGAGRVAGKAALAGLLATVVAGSVLARRVR